MLAARAPIANISGSQCWPASFHTADQLRSVTTLVTVTTWYCVWTHRPSSAHLFCSTFLVCLQALGRSYDSLATVMTAMNKYKVLMQPWRLHCTWHAIRRDVYLIYCIMFCTVYIATALHSSIWNSLGWRQFLYTFRTGWMIVYRVN